VTQSDLTVYVIRLDQVNTWLWLESIFKWLWLDSD